MIKKSLLVHYFRKIFHLGYAGLYLPASLCICYLIFWWAYQLKTLPGLHGDEAWFGLVANQYLKNGINSYTGMTNYTGILQSYFSSLSFQWFGLGVIQLRLPSLIFNFTGLLILLINFRSRNKISSLLLLLYLCQSILYLTLTRIAWEVNTFSIFFFSLVFLSGSKLINSRSSKRLLWTGVFFMANLFGSYNHILFSCITFTYFLSAVFCTFYYRNERWGHFSIITFFALLNVTLVFLAMRYPTNVSIIYYLIAGIILLAGELFITKNLTFNKRFWPKTRPLIPIALFLSIGLVWFSYNHGKALFDLLSQFKLLTNVYSYVPHPILKIAQMIIGAVLIIQSVYLVISDVKRGRNITTTIFLLTYLSLISLYTVENSFRYYILLNLGLGIYLSVAAIQTKRTYQIYVSTLFLSLAIINIELYQIFSHRNQTRAISVNIGNHQMENSAHFLPKDNLIKFLRANQVKEISYEADSYFIEQPVLFYKLFKSWNEIDGHTAIVDYSTDARSQGFLLQYIPRSP